MRTPYVVASDISHSVLRQQTADWAIGQTAAKNMQTAHKGLLCIRDIWQAVN